MKGRWYKGGTQRARISRKKLSFCSLCLKGRWYKGGTLIYFFSNFKRKKNINFQNIKLVFNSIFHEESNNFSFARISRKNYFLNPLFEGKMIQRVDPYQLFYKYQGKNNINFQHIKLIFNSIFYEESKEFTFSRISRKKLLFEPSVWRENDTKGEPLLTFLRISSKKKILIFKVLNSFLIVYFIKSPNTFLSLDYLEKITFWTLFSKGRWYKGGTLIYFFENFKRRKKY